MPRPASAPKNKRALASKRPDIDKLSRAILDAITNVILEDDSQVTTLMATKIIANPGEQPGVWVSVLPLPST